MIRALDRELSADELGITLSHEHLTIDLSKKKNDEDARVDYESVISSLKKAKKYGLQTVVDLSNIGMGRNIKTMKLIRDKLGINVIASTGFYKEPYLPEYVEEKNEIELAQIMINEINEGIENTNLRASVIGEIGTGEKFREKEKKIFKAAVNVQKETNSPIITHLTLGKLGLEQIDFLLKNGANLQKVLLSHLSLSNNIDYVLEVAKRGVYLGLDTIGKKNYQTNAFRLKLIKKLIATGYEDKILLSLDITRNSHLEQYGYQYLFEEFIPAMRKAGLSKKKIEKFLVTNPGNFFCIN